MHGKDDPPGGVLIHEFLLQIATSSIAYHKTAGAPLERILH